MQHLFDSMWTTDDEHPPTRARTARIAQSTVAPLGPTPTDDRRPPPGGPGRRRPPAVARAHLRPENGAMLTRFVATVFYRDVAVGLDLFEDGLGMSVVHRDGDLVVLERDGAKIQLVQNARAARGERPELGLETDDVDAVHADVAGRRPDLLHPNLPTVRLRPWGAREFALLDRTTVCVVVREWPAPPTPNPNPTTG